MGHNLPTATLYQRHERNNPITQLRGLQLRNIKSVHIAPR